MHNQVHGYFGMIGIGNVRNIALPNTLVVSELKQLASSAQKLRNFYDRVCSDMIAKASGGSTRNNSIRKLRIKRG